MKKVNEEKLTIKYLVIILHLILITILSVLFYGVYKEENTIKSWEKVNNTKEYTYITISKMSESFAKDEEQNKTFHFVIEQEDTGLWHTYVVAIAANNYDKFKKIIDYSYERTSEKPKEIKAYGYPVIADNNLKDLVIKNISKFLPKENEITIDASNYEKYLTNCYLDTTIGKKESFSLKLAVCSFFLFLMIISLFLVIVSNLFIEKIYLYKKSYLKKVKR